MSAGAGVLAWLLSRRMRSLSISVREGGSVLDEEVGRMIYGVLVLKPCPDCVDNADPLRRDSAYCEACNGEGQVEVMIPLEELLEELTRIQEEALRERGRDGTCTQ